MRLHRKKKNKKLLAQLKRMLPLNTKKHRRRKRRPRRKLKLRSLLKRRCSQLMKKLIRKVVQYLINAGKIN